MHSCCHLKRWRFQRGISLFFLMMNIMQRSTNKAASICLFYLIVKYLWCKPINLDFNEQIPQDNVSVCSLHFQLDIFRSHHIFSIGCPRHCLIHWTQQQDSGRWKGVLQQYSVTGSQSAEADKEGGGQKKMCPSSIWHDASRVRVNLGELITQCKFNLIFLCLLFLRQVWARKYFFTIKNMSR